MPPDPLPLKQAVPESPSELPEEEVSVTPASLRALVLAQQASVRAQQVSVLAPLASVPTPLLRPP